MADLKALRASTSEDAVRDSANKNTEKMTTAKMKKEEVKPDDDMFEKQLAAKTLKLRSVVIIDDGGRWDESEDLRACEHGEWWEPLDVGIGILMILIFAGHR